MTYPLANLCERLRDCSPCELAGSVVRFSGMTVSVADFPAPVGALVSIERGGDELRGEVIGFRDELTLVSLLDPVQGLRHGQRVRLAATTRTIRVGEGLLGRVINAHGQPIDGKPALVAGECVPLERPAPAAIERRRIDEPLSTGVRAIDGLLTCGKGQRMGIFAGSGVGKSVTLGMMARGTAADVIVVALVGERGREAQEFIERDLGAALGKCVLVVATSDEPPLARVQAAFTATSVAEYFRDSGQDVLLVVDSLTRLALAQREIGLAAGEPPTTRGFPPSVFAMLPRLVERAGRTQRGSITGFYSVLVEGDDPNEPIADAVRGLLDGHTWLDRELAGRGHYPAIDVLQSVSRLALEVTSADHQQAANQLRKLLAALRDHADLISIGAYRPGSNAAVDRAIEREATILTFLQQGIDERSSVADARDSLALLVA